MLYRMMNLLMSFIPVVSLTLNNQRSSLPLVSKTVFRSTRYDQYRGTHGDSVPSGNVRLADDIYRVSTSGQNIYFNDERFRYKILDNMDSSSCQVKLDPESGGAFISLHLSEMRARADVSLGRISMGTILCFSRIKRWWQAPSFHKSTDTIPVESQLLLLEVDSTAMESPMLWQLSKLADGILDTRSASFPRKKYVLIAPLIDFAHGFRVTLYGEEGGPAGSSGMLGVRAESGDPSVLSARVDKALYIAAGSDPYELLRNSYSTISKHMGSFRTRDAKPLPPNLDLFGFCTWDAFYSSVDSEKVLAGVKSLQAIGASPRFLIIDDGWQSTKQNLDSADIAQKDRLSKAGLKEQSLADGSAVESAQLFVSPQVTDAEAEPSLSVDATDGELSGVQIDGSVAAEVMASSSDASPLLRMAAAVATKFYTEVVEKGKPNSVGVKLWTFLAKTVLKEKLVDFFAKQTDFSKRLASWKANLKFEDPRKGKSLKSFVQDLKSTHGIKLVYVWHALSGYWGGVSEDAFDDLNIALSENALGTTGGIGGDGATAGTATVGVEHSGVSCVRNTHTEVSALPAAVRRTYSAPSPHLLLVEPALAWDPASLVGVGSVAPHKLKEMYRKMHAYLADAGVDGVKVDAQSGIGSFGAGNGGGAAIARACVRAMEDSVRTFFGPNRSGGVVSSDGSGRGNVAASISTRPRIVLSFITPGFLKRRLNEERVISKESGLEAVSVDVSTSQSSRPHAAALSLGSETPLGLTGCMCHSTENLYNFYETSTARASDDFYPKDLPAQTVHIASCAFNSAMLGEIAVPDWDMFHSLHPYAEMHAAARAVSGGPVYVSDAPGAHNTTVLHRLVLRDGGTLRAQLPGRPTIDCLFADVMHDGKTALKVWNMNKVNAVIGVFNVQGSSWDKTQRRYVRQETGLCGVRAEVRPTDLPDRYFSSLFSLTPPSSIPLFSPPSPSAVDASPKTRQQEASRHYPPPLATRRFSGLGSMFARLQIAGTISVSLAKLLGGWGYDLSDIRKLFFVNDGTTVESAEPLIASSSSPPAVKFLTGTDGVTSSIAGGTERSEKKTSPIYTAGSMSAGESMFIAWSAAQMKLSILPNRHAAVKLSLPSGPVGWDVVSFSALLAVKTKTKIYKAIVGSKIPYKATKREDDDTALLSASQPIDNMGKSDNDSVPRSPLDDLASTLFFGDDRIYWSPVGLLDMINAGGAVLEIVPTVYIRRALFRAKGLADRRFGVYSSHKPKQIYLNGKTIPFTYTRKDLLVGGLVEFSSSIGAVDNKSFAIGSGGKDDRNDYLIMIIW